MANRLEKVRARRLPIEKRLVKFAEAYEAVQESEATRYLIGSMQPIDAEYTKNTYREAERVQEQLTQRLTFIPEYRYQGSVTNDTHIKAHSDVDLLVLHVYFTTLEPPQIPLSPYAGDPLGDLQALRRSCVTALGTAFPAVLVDDSGARSITLTGGSLQRKIDVVIANWWDTVDFSTHRAEFYRGVMVLDKDLPARVRNKPFLHNVIIDIKDKRASGNLRKVIRLLKSLKYDADSEVRISSYDIASIAYNMPDSWLQASRDQDLLLANNALNYLTHLRSDAQARSSVFVPNGMRKIFGGEGATEQGLADLHRELAQLLYEVQNDLSRSFRKLAEARVAY